MPEQIELWDISANDISPGTGAMQRSPGAGPRSPGAGTASPHFHTHTPIIVDGRLSHTTLLSTNQNILAVTGLTARMFWLTDGDRERFRYWQGLRRPSPPQSDRAV
ncbi:unnamed protein product [Lota lota]